MNSQCLISCFHSLIHILECSHQPPFLLYSTCDRHRKAQLTQCRDQQIMESLSPVDTLDTATSASTTQGTPWERWQKACKRQNTRECAVRQSLLERTAQMRLNNGNISAHAILEGILAGIPLLDKALWATSGCREEN